MFLVRMYICTSHIKLMKFIADKLTGVAYLLSGCGFSCISFAKSLDAMGNFGFFCVFGLWVVESHILCGFNIHGAKYVV